MYEVTVEKTKTLRLPDLIESVIEGEEIIFTRDNLPVAKLVAIDGAKLRPQFGSAKGMFTLTEDFDAPLQDFEEYR